MNTQLPFQSFALKFADRHRSALQFKSMVLMLGAIFLLSSAAFAQGLATCSDYPGVLIPDGTNNRSIADAFTSVPASGVATFAFGGFFGHSYSVEVAEPMAKSTISFNNFGTVLRAGSDINAGDHCNDTTAPLFNSGVVITTGSDPVGIQGNFTRMSFIATTTLADATHAYFIIVTNRDNSNAHDLSVRVVDTTLYNPRWSTSQGYITVYGFMNTTNQTIHAFLKVNIAFGGSGFVTYSPAGIAPGAQLLVAVGPGLTINIPAGEGGTATLAHDGPPGGLMVDAYFANSVSLVPAVFAPRNSQH